MHLPSRFVATLVAAALTVAMLPLASCAADAAKPTAKQELGELVQKIKTKLGENKNTEQDLAEEIKQFDVIYAAHKEEKTDEVAEILLMKASLFMEVFENIDKAREIALQLKKELPETAPGKRTDDFLQMLDQRVKVAKIQENLKPGNVFPEFDEKDLDGKPLSIARFKGKVLLIDFWATWCGPCIAELPNVQEAYKKHQSKGFDILGISLDNEKEKLTAFMKKNDMPWPQFFDGKGWGNKLAVTYGIQSIPATYLLDKDGKIVARNLRGPALEAEIAKLLK